MEVEFLSNGSFNKPGAAVDKMKKDTESWSQKLLDIGPSFANKFNGALDWVGGKFFDIGEAAATALTAAFTVGAVAATKMAIDFNSEMEKTTLSIAAMANANGAVDSFGGGVRVAGDAIRQMRLDARELPGEFKDLANIMATISGPASGMGLDVMGQEKLAKDTMMAAAVGGVSQNVAAREMAMMLSGTARHNMPLFNRIFGGTIDVKDFNKLDASHRLSTIRNRLEAVNTPEAVGYAKNTWEALRSNFVDSMRQAAGAVGSPLFESLKDRMRQFADYTKNNHDGFVNLGLKLGQEIDNAFNHGVDAILHWYPIVVQFGKTLEVHLQHAWDIFGPMMHHLLDRLEAFMKDPQAFDKIESLVKEFIALRAAGAVAGVGATGANALLGLVGETAGGGAAGAAAMAAGAGPLAIALGVLTVATYGAADALLDSQSVFHGTAKSLLKDTADHAKHGLSSWEKVGNMAKPLADALGVVLLDNVNRVSKFFDYTGSALDYLGQSIKYVDNAMVELAQKIFHIPVLSRDDDERYFHDDVAYGGFVGGGGLGIAIKALDALGDENKKNKVPNTQVHVGRIEIKVESNQDPNRIARKTYDILMDNFKNPKFASGAGVPSYTPKPL